MASRWAPGNMELVGLHAHIGSQIFAAEGFAEAARKLIAFLAKIKADYGKALPELDLGGGYGIAYTEADQPRDIEAIAEHLAQNIVAACLEQGLQMPQISIEPGRAIAGLGGGHPVHRGHRQGRHSGLAGWASDPQICFSRRRNERQRAPGPLRC